MYYGVVVTHEVKMGSILKSTKDQSDVLLAIVI